MNSSRTPAEPDTLSRLATETLTDSYTDLDTWPVSRLVRAMNAEDATVAGAVAAALDSITPAIEAVTERLSLGGRLIYVGAGTSGRLATLDASECPPTFSTPPEQVFALMAGGEKALVVAIEGAEDDTEAGRRDIDRAGVTALDTVLGLAASGRTPYVIAAIERARELGAVTVGLSCNTATPLSAAAQYPIEVVTGPEFIAGSTRLKSGTAQKLVLNMFSTISMIKLGKTYGGYMIDLRATNAKLRERACRIVVAIARVSPQIAAAALDQANQRVKPAVLIAARGLDLGQAEALLANHHDNLRQALEAQ